MGEAAQKRKEIYTYQAPWLIYGMNWSVRADQKFRLAIGSFEEEYNNSVRIVQLDEESHQFVDCGGFEHPYPTTKIMWMPDQAGNHRDLLATTGDYLRLWHVLDNKSVRLEALLNNNKNTEFCAPLTSFDWNEQDPNIIGTSSIDTTCIIWDISKMQAKTQLIAHDKEVCFPTPRPDPDRTQTGPPVHTPVHALTHPCTPLHRSSTSPLPRV